MGILGLISAIFCGFIFAVIVSGILEGAFGCKPFVPDDDDDIKDSDDDYTVKVMPEQIKIATALQERISEEAKASQKGFVDEIAPKDSFLRNVAMIAAGVSIPLLLFGGSNSVTNDFDCDCDF